MPSQQQCLGSLTRLDTSICPRPFASQTWPRQTQTSRILNKRWCE